MPGLHDSRIQLRHSRIPGVQDTRISILGSEDSCVLGFWSTRILECLSPGVLLLFSGLLWSCRVSSGLCLLQSCVVLSHSVVSCSFAPSHPHLFFASQHCSLPSLLSSRCSWECCVVDGKASKGGAPSRGHLHPGRLASLWPGGPLLPWWPAGRRSKHK